ncbi:hypothetical protein F5Y12DRAFT_781027 [Xylaria sp. FL1777]|nr:hypothetical protein F5Y12DRAFT_781027 [Xylaria sp. FL1777]
MCAVTSRDSSLKLEAVDMMTVPCQQSSGSRHGTATNGSKPDLTLDDKNGQASEEHQVEFIGTLETITASAKAYDETVRAKVEVLAPGDPSGEVELLGCLGKLLGFLKSLDCLIQVKLTLLLSREKKRRRLMCNDDDDSCQPSDHHLQQAETANQIQERDPNLCGNCGSSDHKAAVCIKVGESGWMEACCKCDSLQHTYEHCPQRQQDEDFEYLILNRGNKGPVKCSLPLGRVVLSELSRNNSSYKEDDVIALPFSSVFSRQAVEASSGSWYDAMMWNNDGDPVEPTRCNQSLGRAVSILRDQRWTIEEEEIEKTGLACENCCSFDHSVYHCARSCGFCGSNKHQTFFCEHRDKACFCHKYPGHSRWECSSDCWYCDDVQGRSEKHGIEMCPKVCHYCLQVDHTTEKCEVAMKVKTRACSRCPKEAYHYPLVHMICPGARCKRLLTTPCEEHCPDCG